MDVLVLLSCLVFWHIIFDYALQGQFMSDAKNMYRPINGVPWWMVLGSHSFLHGFGVFIILGSPLLGLLEFLMHFGIDQNKCRGVITFEHDQALHFLCKVVWMSMAIVFPNLGSLWILNLPPFL